MATCALTTGFERYNCETAVGGVQELYLLPKSSFTSITVVAGEITVITQVGTPTWYAYALTEEVGLFETTETFSKANNSLFYEANLSFTLNKMEAVKSTELALVVLQEVVAIVKTENGEYYFMGDFRGVHKSGGSNNATSGTAWGDLNGYNVNLQSIHTTWPYEIQSSVVTALTIDYNS